VVRWCGASLGFAFRRRYVLVERVGGRTRELPVRSRQRPPFDVDLGPDGRGGIVAVYSRCRDESHRTGCDLYLYSFASRRDSAWARCRAAGPMSACPRSGAGTWRSCAATGKLLIGDLRTGARRRIPGGSAPEGLSPRGRARTRDSFGPFGLDLRGEALTFTWDTVEAHCPRPAPITVQDLAFEVWLVTPRRREMITRACEADDL
jgi:hypothetical protein